MKKILMIMFMGIVAITAGCASGNYYANVYPGKNYPPSVAKDIPIYNNVPPCQYEVIGEVGANGYYTEAGLKAKAAEMGGDAIVIQSASSTYLGNYNTPTMVNTNSSMQGFVSLCGNNAYGQATGNSQTVINPGMSVPIYSYNVKGVVLKFNIPMDKASKEASAYYNRGYAYVMSGDFDKAIEDFNKTIQLNANYPDVYGSRGFAYYKKKKYDQAIHDLKRNLEANPKESAETYCVMGYAYDGKGDYNQSLSCFSKAMSIKPKIVPDYYKAVIYEKSGKYDDAINCLDNVISASPDQSQSYCMRAIVYCDKQNYQKALNDINKALEINPKDTTSLKWRAIVYYYMKNYDKSWDDVRNVRALREDVEPQFLQNLKQNSGRNE